MYYDLSKVANICFVTAFVSIFIAGLFLNFYPYLSIASFCYAILNVIEGVAIVLYKTIMDKKGDTNEK